MPLAQATSYPGLCEPTLQGGLGFDYRLASGPSEMWRWLAQSSAWLLEGGGGQEQARAGEAGEGWSVREVSLAGEVSCRHSPWGCPGYLNQALLPCELLCVALQGTGMPS